MPEPHVTTYEGQPGRECGEHRPTIDRAWCFDCSEWCYPNAPCARCELPMVRAELERLRAELDTAEWEAALLARQRDAVLALCDNDEICLCSVAAIRDAFLTDPAAGEVPDASS